MSLQGSWSAMFGSQITSWVSGVGRWNISARSQCLTPTSRETSHSSQFSVFAWTCRGQNIMVDVDKVHLHGCNTQHWIDSEQLAFSCRSKTGSGAFTFFVLFMFSTWLKFALCLQFIVQLKEQKKYEKIGAVGCVPSMSLNQGFRTTVDLGLPQVLVRRFSVHPRCRQTRSS